MPSLVLASPGAIALKIGALTVRWYGIFIACGFLASAFFASKMGKKRGYDPEKILNAGLIGFVGGIVGGRLYYVLLNLPQFMRHPDEIMATWNGGMSIHGGIIGGVLAGALYCRSVGIPFLVALDMGGCVIPIGQAIGRWGNFFNSEAFGLPVDANFPIKLRIPPAQRPMEYLSYEYFHPTFLYESIWNLFVFVVMYFYIGDRLQKYPGMAFMAYMALYSVGRLCIESLRTDSIMLGPWPAPTVVSIVIIVGAVVTMVAQLVSVRFLSKSEEQK